VGLRSASHERYLGLSLWVTMRHWSVISHLPLVDTLSLYLDDALPLLQRYYNEYDGRYFERLGEGGSHPDIAHRFTADDLVAVSMLGVDIHPKAAIAILVDQADDLNGLLREIPNDVDLWEVTPDVVDDGSSAARLWDRLDGLHGVGWVIAGKLLARKRPRLIPVYDRVVRAAVGNPDHWWLKLRLALQDETLRGRLDELRTDSKVGANISLLRILDVAIWMTGERTPSNNARKLDERRTVPPSIL
jgi:hypothetical protein